MTRPLLQAVLICLGKVRKHLAHLTPILHVRTFKSAKLHRGIDELFPIEEMTCQQWQFPKLRTLLE